MMTFEIDFKTVDPPRRRTLQEVVHLSRGLTVEEVLASFGMDLEDLAEQDETFKRDFKIAFMKGRASGKREAIDKLFNQMTNAKGGDKACLEYLSRFGDKWSDEAEGITGFSMKFGKDK